MELALVLIYIITLVYIAMADRYRRYASLIGMQGWLLLGIALLRLHSFNLFELLFIVLETLIFKAIVIPRMMHGIIERSGIYRIQKGSTSLFWSVILSVLSLSVCSAVTYYIADASVNTIFFGVSLFALTQGMLLITTRRRLLAHLTGFLVIENGVFLFSMAVGIEMPFLINMAILLDIIISVLLLGVFIRKIGEDKPQMTADNLSSIRD